MSRSSVGGDILTTSIPNPGNDFDANAPGNFGISDPSINSVDFGPGGSIRSIARFAGKGIPPKSHGSIALKSWEFLQYQYLTPPTNDNANMYLKSGMLAFTIREKDCDDGATLTYPLFLLNQLMRDQWNDFVQATSPPSNDPEMLEFLGWLQKYGEQGLLSYHKAEKNGDLKKYDDAGIRDELHQFRERAMQDGYCYLTQFGILNKINWSGVVINTNRAESLDTLDDTVNTRHYSQANMGLAKRLLTAQCFGPADHITTGSTCWIALKRELCHNGKYGCYVLYPGGSKLRKAPLPHELRYVDERGDLCTGFVWTVGTVIDPAKGSPQPAALEAANNTGYYTSPDASSQMFATLPTMYLAVGYKQ